jgi:hypothetical protein
MSRWTDSQLLVRVLLVASFKKTKVQSFLIFLTLPTLSDQQRLPQSSQQDSNCRRTLTYHGRTTD